MFDSRFAMSEKVAGEVICRINEEFLNRWLPCLADSRSVGKLRF
jgi:hypothetical protein